MEVSSFVRRGISNSCKDLELNIYLSIYLSMIYVYNLFQYKFYT